MIARPIRAPAVVALIAASSIPGLALEKPAAAQEPSLARLGFERRFVEVSGAGISYLVRKGTEPALLLVPGSFDRADSFLGVIGKLEPKRRIVVVELRGHGESWPPPSVQTGTIRQFAEDVFAVADDAGLEAFYVGGHSIGGMTAIECAGRRPDRLRGVISIEGWTRAPVLRDAFQGRTDNTLSDDQRGRRSRSRRETTDRWSKEQVSGFVQIWQGWDGAEILERTELPVLELWGDRGDARRPARQVLAIPDRPKIDLVWVPGASHFLTLERPAETAAAINGFLRSVESERR
jgi:pimeloyl-ACP methyl ester carboxylesterase